MSEDHNPDRAAAALRRLCRWCGYLPRRKDRRDLVIDEAAIMRLRPGYVAVLWRVCWGLPLKCSVWNMLPIFSSCFYHIWKKIKQNFLLCVINMKLWFIIDSPDDLNIYYLIAPLSAWSLGLVLGKQCRLSSQMFILNGKSHDVSHQCFPSPDVPSGPPQLALSRVQWSPGEVLRANCTFPGARPPSELHWYINGKKVRKLLILIIGFK